MPSSPCALFIYILWKPLIYSTNKSMKNFFSKTIRKVFLILSSCILFCRQKNWLWTYLGARISYLGETRICKSRVARENRSGEIGCPRHFTAFFSGRLPRKIGSWFRSMRTGWKQEKESNHHNYLGSSHSRFKNNQKRTPIPGVEPGFARWKRTVLTVTLYRRTVHDVFVNLYKYVKFVFQYLFTSCFCIWALLALRDIWLAFCALKFSCSVYQWRHQKPHLAELGDSLSTGQQLRISTQESSWCKRIQCL